MSPLRQKMIDAMRQRGFSLRTHKSYIEAVKNVSRFHKHSLAQVTDDNVARYFEHLARELDLSPSTCRVSSACTAEGADAGSSFRFSGQSLSATVFA